MAESVDHASAHFLATGRDGLVATLAAELDRCRLDLTTAEVEAATWNRIDGTPRVNDATKNRHVKTHLTYWQGEVTRLKFRVRELETDLEGLPLIQG